MALNKIGRCPKCGKVISFNFPIHDCRPRKTEPAPKAKTKPRAAALLSTHDGKRVKKRGKCEVCATATNWTVTAACGREGAYWCGCGN